VRLHQPEDHRTFGGQSQASAEGIQRMRARERTRTPDHLFTRSRHNVQARASTPEVWHDGAEEAPEARPRCCPGCCQPGHEHSRPFAVQLANDVRSPITHSSPRFPNDLGHAEIGHAVATPIGSPYRGGQAPGRSTTEG
jgi:hypothetical protein